MTDKKTVLSVGQCRPDQAAITHYLSSSFDIRILTADLRQTALELLQKQPVDLVLVNRILDADGGDGLEIIREIVRTQSTHGAAVMLVSNFPEWQDLAVAEGAHRGFGKAQLNRPETRKILAQVLETPAAPSASAT